MKISRLMSGENTEKKGGEERGRRPFDKMNGSLFISGDLSFQWAPQRRYNAKKPKSLSEREEEYRRGGERARAL